MALSIKDFEKIKSKVDQLKREQSRAEGALESVMERIKDEFDCDSMAEAKELQKKLNEAAKKAETKYREALEEFEQNWGDLL